MGHSSHCFETYIVYYPNGKIKNTGQQGFIGGGGASVGLHKEYNEDGKLVRTKDFIYPERTEEENQSSEFLPYVIEYEYYASGKFRNRKIYKAFDGTDHPDDDDEGLRRLGEWEYYDEQGNIVKTEKYSNFDVKTGENKKGF